MNARSPHFIDCLYDVATKCPAQTAIVDGSYGNISFAEVINHIERLSAHLLASTLANSSVNPASSGSVVGLRIARSAEFVIAALACWRLAWGFLPIDPEWPEVRTQAITESNEVVAVLEAQLVREVMSSRSEIQPTLCAPPSLRDETTAYIIWTSGSSGRPKGVVVEHRGLMNLFRSQIRAFDIQPNDRIYWMLNTAFDASISDIGTALLAGATLICAAPDEINHPRQLVGALERHRATHIDIPPALLRLIEPIEVPASVRTVVFGGEPCPPDIIRKWAKTRTMVNVYGPTEATVCSSLCCCDAETWTRPLLGQPIEGMSYSVLDDHARPVGQGGVGQLAISGAGLARGYWNDPELTAQKFINIGGTRFYLTGDRVAFENDGEYRYVGRIDRQVKLNGKLIELAEIESTLQASPSVVRAAVIVDEVPESAAKTLTAYVTLRESNDVARLRDELRERLPHWMIPGRIERVDSMPLTSSGKVDYPKLACLAASFATSKTTEQIPNDDTAALLAICRRAVAPLTVDLDSNFSAQGFDSLAALRFIASAEANGWAISPALLMSQTSLRDVFHSATQAATSHDQGMHAEELRNDARRVLSGLLLPCAPPPARTGPGQILLTGATGGLGVMLLRELLARTSQEIVCLVRGESDCHARDRLRIAVEQHGGASACDRDRLIVLRGDLKCRRFGCDIATWNRLTEGVDVVYHSAARVHLLASYNDLRTENVLGTGNVLEFASQGRMKTLHYISTLSVFVATDSDSRTYLEDDDLSNTLHVFGGYAQSKWAAEHLVRLATPRIGKVVIYRPGLITGDSTTGRSIATASDFLSKFLRGLIQLGCVPETANERLEMDITPLDYAAAAILHISLQTDGGESARTYHIAGAGRLSLGACLAALNSSGFAVKRVATDTWNARLATMNPGDTDASTAALALCRGIPGEGAFARFRTMDLFQATDVVFDKTRTNASLASSGIVCRVVDDELVKLYLENAVGAARPLT